MCGFKRQGFVTLLIALFLSVVLAPSAGAQTAVAPPHTGLYGAIGQVAPPQDPNAGAGGNTGAIRLSSRMLGPLAEGFGDFQLGYIYSCGAMGGQGRLVMDYSLPVTVNQKDVVFFQCHGRFEDLFKTLGGAPFPHVQCLAGGGYRKRFPGNVMVGLNGFRNSIREYGRWYSSVALGWEFAALTRGDTLTTMNLNYYGNVFSGMRGIKAAFGEGAGDWRVEMAHSMPLQKLAADLRLKITAYRLHKDRKIRGWNVGADITAKKGLYLLRGEVGRDPLNSRYYTINASINLAFSPDKLMSGHFPLSIR